jgi:hypothetical protein
MRRTLTVLAALATLATAGATAPAAPAHTISGESAREWMRDFFCGPHHGHCMSFNYQCRLSPDAFRQRWSEPRHRHEVQVDWDHKPDGSHIVYLSIWPDWVAGWPPPGCS